MQQYGDLITKSREFLENDEKEENQCYQSGLDHVGKDVFYFFCDVGSKPRCVT